MKKIYISPSVSEYGIDMECGFCGSMDVTDEGANIGIGDEYKSYYDEEA